LENQPGPARDIVILNAGAALYAANRADSIIGGIELARAAIASGATVNFFIEQVFNFPTMTEAYRIAAFDAIKQMNGAAAGVPAAGVAGLATSTRVA
jgi:hypothetical protein